MPLDRAQLWVNAVLELYVGYRTDEKRTNVDEDVARALADAPPIVDAIAAKLEADEKARADTEAEQPTLIDKALGRTKGRHK